MANLRTAFRWAADQSDLEAATAISAHAVLLGFARIRLEPVSWVEEILEAATAAEVRHLPRLYTAAAQAMYTGRPDAAVAYAEIAIALEDDPRYDPFEPGWARLHKGLGYVYTDRLDQYIEIVEKLAEGPAPGRVYGLAALISALEAAGRGDEARKMADESVARAREAGNPCWIAWALWSYGLAFAEVDPLRASIAWREGLAGAQQDKVSYFEATIARDAAGLDVEGRDLRESLELFDIAVSSFHLAGNHSQLIITLSTMVTFFERIGRYENAAVIIGALTRQPSTHGLVPNLDRLERTLRTNLGEAAFEQCLADHAVFELGPAALYAQREIHTALAELSA
jgi:tetratricopeptide (TPR) repeat protein